jgi:hypothetical protein
VRETLEEKLGVALRVIADYGRVLERHAEGGVLMPESQLPAGRDAIKACLLLSAAWRIADGADRDEIAARGRIAYATLAHFVPDAVAAREAAFNAAAQQALGCIARKDAPPGELAASVADAPVAEMEGARAGYEALASEFDVSLAAILSEWRR